VCNNPTSQTFISWPWQLIAHVPSLNFVGNTLSVSALICRVTFTFDLLTLELVRIISRGVGNLPTDLIVIDLSANTCQTHRMTLQY